MSDEVLFVESASKHTINLTIPIEPLLLQWLVLGEWESRLAFKEEFAETLPPSILERQNVKIQTAPSPSKKN